MWIIGDVHGQFSRLKEIIEEYEQKNSKSSFLQLGDMGIMKEEDLDKLSIINSNFYLFRGNHDDPFLVQHHPQYLSDYGYDASRNLFWVGGGLSIDQDNRIAGRDWWPEEELSFRELNEVLTNFEQSKPSIVVTHECPETVVSHVSNVHFSSLAAKYCPSRTAQALQSMFESHQPDIWVFGHYHVYKEFKVSGTHFVCLDELIRGKMSECVYEIPEIDW